MSHRHAVSSRARRSVPRVPPGGVPRPLALVLALASGFGMVPVLAQPSGAQAVVGSATLSQQGSKLLVTTSNGTGQSHASINWQSFNVPAGTTTWFAQPNAASTVINRVVGADPSAIFGTLGSNGRLVLVNPAGITVGAGAVVDTAGFIASTLRMSDADALAGRLRFGDGATAGLLKVDGEVLARSGDVVLIGRSVEVGAPAVVRSPQGATVLAAGRQAEVTGRGLEGIVFTLQAPADSAVNLGTLSGDAVGVFAGTLRHSGLAQATAVTAEGGRVVLRASDTALVAGTAQAHGLAGAGGGIDVLGQKVGLLAGAVLDTSNSAGGGQIRVGGGLQGQDATVANAQLAYVDADARLRADATAAGNGGRIVVWSDDTTRAHGSFSVRAGAQGGDGGLVETSGKRFLDVEGARVAAGAPQGRLGTWLLDPDDVVITTPSSSPAPQEAYKTTTPAPTSDPATAIFNPATSGQASVIYDTTLNTALNATDGAYVRVLAGTTSAYTSSGGSGSGAIRVVGDVTLGRTAAGAASLELSAVDRIVFTGGTATFQAGGRSPGRLDVTLNATNGVTTEGGATVRLQTLDGDAATRVSATVTNGKTWTNSGTLDLQGNSQLLLNDGSQRATFSNLGKLTGVLGANGGVAGRTDATGAVTRGNVVNQGTVELSGSGQFGAHSLIQPAPASTSAPVPSFSMTGGSLSVDEEFDRQAGGFAFDGSKLTLVRSTGELNLGSGGALRASSDMELISYLGRVVADRSLQATREGVAGGRVVISANNGIEINGDIHASGSASASVGTAAGSISLVSQGGLITTGNLSAIGASGSQGGGAGGTIRVVGNQADVALGFIEASGGQNDNGAGMAGGTVTLSGASVQVASITAMGGSGQAGAGGQGGTVRIDATGDVRLNGWATVDGGFGSGSAAAGAGGAVTLSSSGGAIIANGLSASGGTAQGTGRGGAGGILQVVNSATPATPDPSVGPVAGEVSVRYLEARGGQAGGTGGQGGAASITSTGSISLGRFTEGHGVDLSGGAGSLGGGAGGQLSVLSSAGNVMTDGDFWLVGGAGGTQSGGAGGSISVRSVTGQASLGYVTANGGSGGAGRSGGAGGSVEARAATLLGLRGPMSANGGNGGAGVSGSGGAGGSGGVIALTQDTGDLSLDRLWGSGLSASGGQGGAGALTAQNAANGGAGGAGGTVTLQATQGGLTACLTACEGLNVVAADGAAGGTAGAGGVGGVGGKGGAVALRGRTDSSLILALQAMGGQGGSGAAGGAGGTVDISLDGEAARLALNGQVDAAGGSSSAASGRFSWTAAGGLTVPADYVPTSLQVNALWRNTGALTLAAGSVLQASQLSNAATLTLEPDASLQLTGGRLLNEASGTVQGSGSIDGSVDNAGLLSPGVAGAPIGRIAISGDLVLRSTSRFQADVIPLALQVPGETHDQLAVSGRVTLGGALKVNLLPTPAPTQAPTNTVEKTSAPQANVLAGTSTGMVLIDAGALDGSSQFSTYDVPPEVASQVLVAAAGVTQSIPGAPTPAPVATPAPTSAPVPSPAPSPAPAPATGAPLVQTIVSLLRGNAEADVIQQALSEQDTVVTQFVSLLVKEQRRQEQEARPSIVLTATGCAPGS